MILTPSDAPRRRAPAPDVQPPGSRFDRTESQRPQGDAAAHADPRAVRAFVQEGVRHLSAEDVYKALLAVHLDVGLATVYRVLTQFEQAGLLKRSNFEAGRAVFELNEGAHHDHLVCLTCGRVEEFFDGEIERRQKQIAADKGFALRDHALALYADCPNRSARTGRRAERSSSPLPGGAAARPRCREVGEHAVHTGGEETVPTPSPAGRAGWLAGTHLRRGRSTRAPPAERVRLREERVGAPIAPAAAAGRSATWPRRGPARVGEIGATARGSTGGPSSITRRRSERRRSGARRQARSSARSPAPPHRAVQPPSAHRPVAARRGGRSRRSGRRTSAPGRGRSFVAPPRSPRAASATISSSVAMPKRPSRRGVARPLAGGDARWRAGCGSRRA